MKSPEKTIEILTKEIESVKLSEEVLAIKKKEIENLIKSKGKTTTKAITETFQKKRLKN